jgi:SAM-dependent methyltransferase
MGSRSVQRLVRRAEEVVSTRRGTLANRFLAAKLIPLRARGGATVLTRPQKGPLAADGLPVPPPELWQRWGESADEYLEEGARDAAEIEASLRRAGVEAGELARVLDLGCAEGRVLRFFPRTEGSVRWGVDINAERITWAQQHLSPPLLFATTTTSPHLPFADDYFDLVFGLSVFTHISELADAWFLEVLRVLRPGGHAWLTIHDEHTVDVLLERYGAGDLHAEMVDLLRRLDAETGALSLDWVYMSVLADPAAQVFFHSGYLVERWSRLAACLEVKPEATGYQTALLFRKEPV